MRINQLKSRHKKEHSETFKKSQDTSGFCQTTLDSDQSFEKCPNRNSISIL